MNYQNNIVCGIAERIIRTAPKREINGDKACCDGNRAEHDIGCVQSGQVEIEINGQLSVANATNTTDEEIKAFDFVKAVKVTDDIIYIEKVSNNKEK